MAHLAKWQRKRWQQYLTALRRELPCSRPVRVRTHRVVTSDLRDDESDAGRCYGTVIYKNKQWIIHIDAALPFVARVDSLLHEYAHCLDNLNVHGQSEQVQEEHGESWGIYHSRCYRVKEKVDRL